MILVDSSVWIDYFRGKATAETEWLDRAIVARPMAIGDVILAEVLQGFTVEKDFNTALQLLSEFHQIDIGGRDIAILAAQNFRSLRQLGVTVRKTIDTLIATRCIADNIPLLYSDRDFEPFVQHLGLRAALSDG